MESRYLGGADTYDAAYSISTFTLKNRWVAFVGHTHAAAVRFVFPRTVYTCTSPLELRLGVHVTIGKSFDIVIVVRKMTSAKLGLGWQ